MSDLVLRVGVTKLAVSAVLALVAYAVQRRFERPVVTHALWLLVPTVLLVPAVFTVPLPFAGVSATTPLSASASGGVADGGVGLSWVTAAGVRAGLVLVWLIGSVVVMAWTLGRSVRFHGLLLRASRPASSDWQRLAGETASRMGLAASPVLYSARSKVAPMVWWIGGRVRLVVPTALLSGLDSGQLRWVLAHELAHVRRRDHVVRWLEWLTCVCFWWNPFVWWARRELRAAEEFCCDALVLARMSPQRRAYGGSLLAVIEYLSTSPTLRSPAFASAVDSGGRTTLIERRLKKIMSKETVLSTPRWLRALLMAGAVGAMSLGLVYCDSAEAVGPEPAASDLAGEAVFEAAQVAPVDVDKAKLRDAVLHVRQAIEAGDLTAEQAQKQLKEIELAASGMMRKEREPSRVDAEIAEIGQRIRRAIDAGEITAEEGRRKMEGLKARAEAGADRELHFSAEQRDLELRRATEEIRTAVDAGTITEEQARQKTELLQRKSGG